MNQTSSLVKNILINSFNNYRYSFNTSILSFFWIFFQPLALILLYSVIFGHVLKARIDLPMDNGYTIYIATALLPWIVFSAILQSGSLSILHNASYIRKISLPVSVFVTQDVLENAYNFFAVFLILWVFLFISGFTPEWSWLKVLIPLILLILVSLGISMILAVITVFIRDVEKFLGFFLQLMMWGLPIVYPWDIIPVTWQWIVLYNPLFYYFDSFREILLYGKPLSDTRLIGMFLFSTSLFAFGLWLCRKAEFKVRDVL